MLTQQQIDAVLSCLDAMPWGAQQTRYLDQFFRQTGGMGADASVVAARLAALDAMYGMRLWTRSNITPQNNAAMLLSGYCPRARCMIDRTCSCMPSIHEELTASGLVEHELQGVEEDDITILHEMHSELANIGVGDEPVVASKYLHFCYPNLFPIWDEKVQGLLVNVAGLPRASGSFYGELLAWYKGSLDDPWTGAIRAWAPGNRGTVTSVRNLDAVLWVTALAQGWSDERRVNREVHLYFREHPGLVRLLRLPPV